MAKAKGYAETVASVAREGGVDQITRATSQLLSAQKMVQTATVDKGTAGTVIKMLNKYNELVEYDASTSWAYAEDISYILTNATPGDIEELDNIVKFTDRLTLDNIISQDKANEIVEDWLKKRKDEKMQGKSE